ncbi:MAG: Smr/MutS family protein [Phaeodactylibacter sp.]|nr:Smr/MutS family protein [Phaeodactylibacter sp.]
MLFSIGTRVRFLHSKDEGVVTGLLDNGMVNVRLDGSDFEIPAFIDDLIRAESQPVSGAVIKAKIIQVPDEPKKLRPDRPPIESQYTILKSLGIQLAFDPVLRPDGQAEKYRMYLINDTRYEALFTFELRLNGQVSMRQNGKLAQVTAYLLGDLLFDQLNDNPTVELDCWRITTQGTGSRMNKPLRIKPKQFFKNIRTAPILNRPVHLYRLFDNLKSDIGTAQEDLKTYTMRSVRPAHAPVDMDIHEQMPHEVVEFAEFIPEIDLHIEKLTSNAHKLGNAEILRIQLSHFDAYLDKAIRLGVERVYIIHGVGKGRLRDAIASRLLQMPAVKTFRNEYHPRYGYGATEVVF